MSRETNILKLLLPDVVNVQLSASHQVLVPHFQVQLEIYGLVLDVHPLHVETGL